MTTGWNGRRRIAPTGEGPNSQVTGVTQTGDDWLVEDLPNTNDAQVPQDIVDHDLAWSDEDDAPWDPAPPSGAWSPDTCAIPALLRIDVSNLAFWQRTLRLIDDVRGFYDVGDPVEVEGRITALWQLVDSVDEAAGTVLTPAMRMTLVDRVLADQDAFHGEGSRRRL